MGRPRTGTGSKAITDGLCGCGCGQRTPISSKFQEKNGLFYEKGQPFKYCPGHAGATLEERFWSRVDRCGPDDCWEWQAGARYGYGRLSFRNETIPVHRYSFELAYGPIPDGMYVCHRCGNKRCVNPAHLYAGTAADNNRDTVNQGRCNPRRGKHAATAKITEDDARAIRAVYAQGSISMQTIANRYGLCAVSVWAIIRRKNWKHVE